MRCIGAILCCLMAGAIPASAQSYEIPTTRTVVWSAGSDQWNSGALPVRSGTTCTGLVQGDGTTNNAAAINACITAAPADTAVLIPAGVYYVNSVITMKSSVTLRGAKASGVPFLPTADATATTLKFGASAEIRFGYAGAGYGSGDGAGGSERSIASGYTKGSTSLTMAAGHGFVVGNWLSVFENGDSTIPTTATGDIGTCTWCGPNTGSDLIQQYVRVVSVDGNVIGISRPLYWTYASGNSPGARTWSFLRQYAGLENMRLNGNYADHGQFISMSGTLFCWIKGVETYMAGSGAKDAHVPIAYSHGAEIRDSYFHYGRDSSSDRNYGIAFFMWNSDHKIENNILRHHRHSVVFEGGGAGCAILYNYIDDNYSDDTSYLGSARTNHGAHPMMNLYEGNSISHLTADSYWGSSSHITFFRNWLRGSETGTGVPNFPTEPDWGFIAADLWRNQNYYNVVGNVLGVSSWNSGTVRNGANCNASEPTAYFYGCDSDGNYSAATVASILSHGNYDYITDGVAYWEGGANHVLATSLYYGARPSFLVGYTWPAFGPDLSPLTNAIPAYNRFLGLETPVAPNAPTNVRIR